MSGFKDEKRVIHEILDYADRAQRENLDKFTLAIKDGRDVVTDVDKQIEDYCISLIRRNFPQDDIISEENYSEKSLPRTGRLWIIDPLDGTWNYANDVPSFAIQIAFVIDGSATLSAIGIPFGVYGRETYFAEKGCGAYLNGKKISCNPQVNPKQTIVAISDFSWNKDCERREFAILGSVCNGIGRIRLFGSSAVSFAYLSAGRVNAYLGFDQKLWDIVPGLLIATEAGCKAYGENGNGYVLGEKTFAVIPENSSIESLILKAYRNF